MRKFLDKNNILNSAQYGFHTNSLTDLAITSLYDGSVYFAVNGKTAFRTILP